MVPVTFHDLVSVKRRVDVSSASRDLLGNYIYGDPSTWNYVYQNIPVRLAWSGKQLRVSSTGESIHPEGIGYCSTSIILQPEDRLVTVFSTGVPVGIEYIITACWPSYLGNLLLDHYEFSLSLPLI